LCSKYVKIKYQSPFVKLREARIANLQLQHCEALVLELFKVSLTKPSLLHKIVLFQIWSAAFFLNEFENLAVLHMLIL